MIALAPDFSNWPLDTIATSTGLSAIISWITLIMVWRERNVIKHSFTSKLEVVAATIIMVVAGAAVANTTLLSALTVLTLFRQTHPVISTVVFSGGTLVDAISLPIVYSMLQQGRKSLNARSVVTTEVMRQAAEAVAQMAPNTVVVAPIAVVTGDGTHVEATDEAPAESDKEG